MPGAGNRSLAAGLLLCLLLGLALAGLVSVPAGLAAPDLAAGPAPDVAASALPAVVEPGAMLAAARQPLSPTIFLPLVQQPPEVIVPNVWHAAYHDNEDLAGEPVRTADEVRVDYDWGDGGHPAGLPADHFSARWTGHWHFESGEYTFFLSADDGVRLWLDGQLLVDAWVPGIGSHLATVDVTGDGLHRLTLDYFEATGGAAVHLHWRRTDLYPRWEADYYRLPWVETGLQYSTLDDTIQFDWALGAPTNLPADGFSVAWHAYQLFEPGTTRLHVYADDGFQLFLDGTKLGEGGWYDGQDGGRVNKVYSYDAPALGFHNLTYNFHDRGSLAEARLWIEYVERPRWTAEYFGNRSLEGTPAVVREEETLFYDWGFEKARPILPAPDNFSVRWSGDRYFHSGCYRFGLFADDGVRLWIDGELLVDQWHNGRAEYHSPLTYLAAGPHRVVVEYYEADNEAEIRFWYE